MRSGVQDQPRQHGETPSTKNTKSSQAVEVCACNPSYSGGWGKRITWAWEAEVAVSWDHTTALQFGQQSEILSQKKRKKERGQGEWHPLTPPFSAVLIFKIMLILFFWFFFSFYTCSGEMLMFYIFKKIKNTTRINWIIFQMNNVNTWKEGRELSQVTRDCLLSG